MDNPEEDDDPSLDEDPVYQAVNLLNFEVPPSLEMIQKLDNIFQAPEDPFLESRQQIKQLTEQVTRLEGGYREELKKREEAEAKLEKLVEFITFVHGEFGKLITSLVSLTVKNEEGKNMLNVGPFQDEMEAGEFLEMLRDLSKQFQQDFKNLGGAKDLLQRVDVILKKNPSSEVVMVSLDEDEMLRNERTAASSSVSTVIVDPDVEELEVQAPTPSIPKRRWKRNGMVVPKREDCSELTSMNKKHGRDPSRRHWGYYCLCGSKLSTYGSLYSHIRYFTAEKKFKCEICNDKFSCKSYLQTHMESRHEIINSWQLTCSKCTKQFHTRQDLLDHHSNGCNQNLMDTGTEHGVDNTDKSKFRCLCGKEYAYRCNLSLHINSKLFGKLYQCSLCSQNYHLHWLLKRHYLKSHQVDVGESSVQCLQCQMVLNSVENVTEHQITVHGGPQRSSASMAYQNHRRTTVVQYSDEVENEIRQLLALSPTQSTNQTNNHEISSADDDVICID